MKKLVTLLSLSTLMLLTTNFSLAGGGKHTGKATKSLHKSQMKIKNKENLKRKPAPNRKKAKAERISKQTTPKLQRTVKLTPVSDKKNLFRATYGMN